MTSLANQRSTVILVIGDIISYTFSLVLALAIRYNELPGKALLFAHLSAFAVLFVIFLVVNFSAGLYDKQTSLLGVSMRGLVLRAQVVNIIIGVIFFYFAPVAIAPKTNLFIYFVISTLALIIWRVIMYPVFMVTKKQVAILIGVGDDIDDLHDEVNGAIRYGITFKERMHPLQTTEETVTAIAALVKRTRASVIVADFHEQAIESAMPFLYSMVFSGVQIIDASKLYEAVFDRIPLSMVGERWLVENSSAALGTRRVYDGVKRAMDVFVAGIAGLVSLAFYPFVYAAIKLDDKGPLFISQERVGKNGKTVTFYKFRSMSGNDHGRYGANGATTHQVTRVGKILRNTRIDELPQLWSVIKGDLSLIGPRPEFPALVAVYEKEIPYYNARHLVKPGLSGWAQIYHQAHPHHAVATLETRDKLSYDLYYIKNRSLTLDLKIALRTIEILMKRVGK